jgi:hypothetical protein
MALNSRAKLSFYILLVIFKLSIIRLIIFKFRMILNISIKYSNATFMFSKLFIIFADRSNSFLKSSRL